MKTSRSRGARFGPFGLVAVVGLLWATTSEAVTVRDGEMRVTRRWVTAKLAGRVVSRPPQGHLSVALKAGQLLKNMATTKVYHTEVGALPLKIRNRTFRRGLYCPSTGKIVVDLPAPAKRFDAVLGVDSNRVQSFYSNAGRGRVIGSVEVAGTERFQSQVLREGLAGVPVSVELDGATQFTLGLRDAGGGIVERVDFNQADWADARVTLENGQTVWLGDMPVGPLHKPPTTEVPFSFVYAGRHSREFLKDWDRTYSVRDLDARRRELTLAFKDPDTGLEIRCVAIEYLRFPVVEWKLLFNNTSQKPTPIIEKILPLDVSDERDNEGEFLLHHSNGSPHSLVKMSDPTDYAPRQTQLVPRLVHRLSSKIGLPASHDLPFFNIEANGRGVIFAIGWPGQWSATLTRDAAQRVQVQAGQQGTHFKLLPGEEVRTPLIAMLQWQGGDWIRSQNLWRRWMIAHNVPRTADGALPPQHIAGSSSAQLMESTGATEKNQLMFINGYIREGLQLDYWWIDAGWYDYTDYWLNVGTWRPNKKRFPNGLGPISSHLHSHKKKLILWFTPECVTRGSFIDRKHPAWLLKGGAEWWMGHALLQGEYPAHVNDSGLTLVEDVAAFGIGNPSTTAMGRTRLADGRWHLVTATRRIDSQATRSELSVYVDGKLDALAFSPNVGPMSANDSWGIGRQYQTRGIRGDIDDVRVFDSALSAQQVADLFRGEPRITPAQHYDFNGSLSDPVGKRHGQRIGTGDPAFVAGVSGKKGDQSLRFNNDYGVKIPNKVPNNFTLSCWVRMDAPQPPPYGRGDFRLVNFGDPEALRGMTEHIDKQIKAQGVDLFRHDGIPPLQYWRANDTPDRQGITEIKHIQGLLAFWDELRKRHPMLRIDICSGGGSRNELETLRRAVPLWRSDYAYETTGMQTLTHGMSLWIPYFGTGINTSDSYTFRSQMAPANNLIWDVRRRDLDYEKCRRLLAQRRQVGHFYEGDYYPLTAHRTENDVWMAWQFDKPKTGQGVVQAFRRPNSSVTSMQFRLRGLESRARYTVQDLDRQKTSEMTGAELAEDGLLVTLQKRRSSAMILYRRIE